MGAGSQAGRSCTRGHFCARGLLRVAHFSPCPAGTATPGLGSAPSEGCASSAGPAGAQLARVSVGVGLGEFAFSQACACRGQWWGLGGRQAC